jgi:hypothetical protein
MICLCLPAQAQTDGMQQEGAYRLGGTYLWVRAGDANACARRCESEARCQAWSFADAALGHSPACEIKSSPGRLIERPGMVSGLSPRTERAGARRVKAIAAKPEPAKASRPDPRAAHSPVSRGMEVPELAGKPTETPGRDYYPLGGNTETAGQAAYYPGKDRLSQKSQEGSGARDGSGDDIRQVRGRILGGGGRTSPRPEYYSGSGDRRPAASRPPREFPDE